MSMVTGAVSRVLDANSFVSKSFVRNYESLISSVRSLHSLTRFVVEMPTHMPEFLKQLPGNFQNYFPTDVLKGIIDNKVLPFEVFLGKFKDHLTFIEVTDRTAKFYDELKKLDPNSKQKTSIPKLISSGTQALQKAIETVLLGDKWNLWNLDRFSFLNLGHVKTFKEVCVIVASTASAIVNQRDKVKEEGLVAKKEDKIQGKLSSVRSLEQYYLQERKADKLDKVVLGKLLNLEAQKKRLLEEIEAQVSLQGSEDTVLESLEISKKQLEKTNEDLKKATDVYITAFFFRRMGSGEEITIPGGIPLTVSSKIEVIAATIQDPKKRQNILLNYKIEKAETKVENAENNATKARISRNFDISKIVIVILGLTASVGILTQVAASVGVTLVAVNGAAWVTGLAVGLLGAWKSYHLAFYGTPKPMPQNPLL